MKTLKLTAYECDVIKDFMFQFDLCSAYCHCHYEQPICKRKNDKGKHECKLQAAIESIFQKINKAKDDEAKEIVPVKRTRTKKVNTKE